MIIAQRYSACAHLMLASIHSLNSYKTKIPQDSDAGNNVLFTLSTGHRPLFEVTSITQFKYAQMHKLKYLVFKNPFICQTSGRQPWNWPYFCKLILAKSLVRLYSRVILVDDSFVFARNAPSLLKLVSSSELGAFVEGTAERWNPHPSPSAHAPDLLLPIHAVPQTYAFNTGLVVFSTHHKTLLNFSLIWLKQHSTSFWTDQEMLNYLAYTARTALHDLGVAWGAHSGIWMMYKKSIKPFYERLSKLHAFHVTSAVEGYASVPDARELYTCFLLDTIFWRNASRKSIMLHAATAASACHASNYSKPGPYVNSAVSNIWSPFFNHLRQVEKGCTSYILHE